MLYATTVAIFCQNLEAKSYLQLTQIRLAYTKNIYHKKKLLEEGSTEIAGAINPSVCEM